MCFPLTDRAVKQLKWTCYIVSMLTYVAVIFVVVEHFVLPYPYGDYSILGWLVLESTFNTFMYKLGKKAVSDVPYKPFLERTMADRGMSRLSLKGLAMTSTLFLALLSVGFSLLVNLWSTLAPEWKFVCNIYWTVSVVVLFYCVCALYYGARTSKESAAESADESVEE